MLRTLLDISTVLPHEGGNPHKTKQQGRCLLEAVRLVCECRIAVSALLLMQSACLPQASETMRGTLHMAKSPKPCGSTAFSLLLKPGTARARL